MTRHLPALLRIRKAVETASGRMLVVPVDDVAELLRIASRGGELPDLDALTGGEPVDPVVPAPRQPPGRVGWSVALAVTREDGARLARAAWEAQPDRPSGWRPWSSLDDAEREALTRMAVVAIRSMSQAGAGE